MYLFCAGNHPVLAKWELNAVLGDIPMETTPLGFWIKDTFVEKKDFSQLQKKLGSIREIIWLYDIDFTSWEHALGLVRDWISTLTGREMTLVAPALNDHQRKEMLDQIKACFDRPIRYRLDKRYLLEEKGIVFWWIEKAPGQFVFGHAVSQQDVAEYSERDYGKPMRSMARGMLPPKLAQMMLNGAQIMAEDIVWDPFCGTGTVLVEAALMGIHVLGSDKDAEAVSATKENVKSLLTEDQQSYVGGIWQQDMTLPWSDQMLTATSIVAEGYLGDPQTKKVAGPHDLRSFWQKVEPLYQKFFTKLNQSPIEKIVLATPVVSTESELSRLAARTWNILLQSGWQIVFKSDYMRSNQIVGREITQLKKLTSND